MKKKTEQNFEGLINKLEKITAELEGREIPLEDSIKKFEEGLKIAGVCFEKLKEAEKKIKVLIEDSSGKFKFENFDLK